MSMNREGFKGSSDDFSITFDNGYTVSVVWGREDWDPKLNPGSRRAVVACFDSNDVLINMSRESWSKGRVEFPNNEMSNIFNATPRDVAQVINFICSK